MLINNVTIEAFSEKISSLNLTKEDVLIVFIAEKADLEIAKLIEVANEMEVNIFGGMFPEVIHGNSRYAKGCILKKFKLAYPPFIQQDLSKGDFSNIGTLELPQKLDKSQFVISFVDAFSENVLDGLKHLNNKVGFDVSIIGGGAGSLSLKQQPCLITNEGLLQDALIFCVIESPLNACVQHGWEDLQGPFIATKTRGTVIEQINWKSPFQVYKSVVEPKLGREIHPELFFDLAKDYPFGMVRQEDQFVVRDPIAVGQNGEIITVGEVPQNSVIYILNGNKSTLLGAVESVTDYCVKRQKNQASHILVIDCISRALYMDDTFSDELDIVLNSVEDLSKTDESIPQGALTIGEISNFLDGTVEFYNKSIVVGMMG